MSTLNPFKEDFKLSVCDGPKELRFLDAQNHPTTSGRPDPNYVPCDFNGLMVQVNFLLNAMIVLGILATIVSLTIAGLYYISGEKGKIESAKKVFKNVPIGFIIMLTSWFIIHQILIWLGVDSNITSLMGQP